jgi:predicted transcriptional regulator
MGWWRAHSNLIETPDFLFGGRIEVADELALLTDRKKSNLSRTLKTMANYGLVRLERGPRGRIAAKVVHDRIELELPLMRNDFAA